MNIMKKYTEKDRYGNMFSYEFDIPSMNEIPKPDPEVFKPIGTDTQPAMLTVGENIVNAEASRIPGVQPMLDQLNEMGRAIQDKQGGPIPTYASGGTKVDDKMLDAIGVVESNNDPNALSGVGAGGQYQIMPKTALNPGYGVSPISLEDRFNPDIARGFAKDYLQGIEKKYPDFNRDQLLQSYHSGVGNVLKNNLGPEGKAYVPKIEAAMVNNEIPPFVSDAEAINMMPQGQNLKAKVNNEEEVEDSWWSKIVKGLDEHSLFMDRAEANMEKRIAQKGTLFKDGLDDVNDDIESLQAEIAKKGSNVSSADVNKLIALKKKKQKLEKLVEETTAKADKLNQPSKEEIENKKKIDDINKTLPNIVNNTKPELKNIVNQIITETNNTKPVKEDDKILKEKGKEVASNDPTAYDRAKGFMSQFFDVGELTRASLVYLGSRALGYEHGSSVNFVGKNYLKRIDSQMAANRKWANSKEATKGYEQSSIQKFLITGDRNDLVKKGSSIVKPLKPMFNTLTQSVVQTVEMADGSVGVRIDGKLVPYSKVAGILDTIDPKIHNSTTIKENFRKSSDQFISYVNQGVDEADQITKASVSTIANQAESLLRNTMKTARFKKGTVARAEVISELDASIKDFYEAKKDYKSGNRKTDPKSLKEFFDKRMITFKTGGAWNPALVGDTGAGKLQEVQNNIFGMLNLNMDSKMSATQKAKVTKNFMDQLSSVWKNYSTMSDAELAEKGLRKNFIGTNTEGLNDFVNWTNEVAKGNTDALKIIGALT